MIENRSAPGPMIASLCYEDLEQAIAWLEEACGSVEQYRYGPPDGSRARSSTSTTPP